MNFRSREKLLVLSAVTTLVLNPGAAVAQVSRLVSMRDLGPAEIRFEAFAIDSATTISIHAIGEAPARSSDGDGWGGNAWILDASDRRVVWALDRDGGGDARFDGTVQLAAGTYLAYFATVRRSPVRSLLDRVLRREPRDTEFAFSISGEGQLVPPDDIGNEPGAFATLTGDSGEDTGRISFTVSRQLDIEVYALGEVATDGFYDYGFLMDAASREILWHLTADSSQYAGGARRNRVDREVLTLPAGSYVAGFVRDDSHHPGDWSDAPPYDPQRWGMTLTTVDPADVGFVEVGEYAPPEWRNVIVELTRVGDRVATQRGFLLRDSMRVRVYVVSEGSRRGMDDQAWITEAASHHRIWTMDFGSTRPAGGSERNRVQHDSIALGPGAYLVSFLSDGSHSYGSWPGGAPFDADSWGITVAALDEPGPDAIESFEPGSSPDVLASLTRVGDDADWSRDFRLDSAQTVRIYAVGEGESGDMYDFAWIEDAAGSTVWEMSFAASSGAGGAAKNRLFDGLITLPGGDYRVRYRSDGSHSFGSWNAARPDDPFAWGVTIYRVPAPAPGTAAEGPG